jgi:hypothetical protein
MGAGQPTCPLPTDSELIPIAEEGLIQLAASAPEFGAAIEDELSDDGPSKTVLATALASLYHKDPFGQVDAGLRTGRLYARFPEEASQSGGMTGRNRTVRFRSATSFGMTSRLEPRDQIPHLTPPLQGETQHRVRLEPVHVSPQFLTGHPNLVGFAY